MPSVGLELTIPAFKREKTVHADRAAAVIGGDNVFLYKIDYTASDTGREYTLD
jgi:hypothetical protein